MASRSAAAAASACSVQRIWPTRLWCRASSVPLRTNSRGSLAAEQCRRMRKQARGFRRIARQGEHVRMLPPCPEHRIASVMARCLNAEKSMAMAIAIVTMLNTVLAMTMDPAVAESSR